MKKTSPSSILSVAVVLLIQSGVLSALAATNYWDNDGANPGFGTAAGTWAAPTIGDSTQGWSPDDTGSTVPVNYTTTTNDALFFGTGVGLASGTITVSGTVEANSLTIGSASGAITLDGGTIVFGGTNAAPRFTVNNTGNIVNSALRLDNNTSVFMGTQAALALTLNGSISGNSNLTFTTPAVSFNNADQAITLGALSTYGGNTTITTGNQNNRLRVRANSGGANTLPASTVLTLDGGNGTGTGRTLIYDLNGNDQTLAGLKSVVRSLRTQQIANTPGTPVTLTISNTLAATWAGNIAAASISVVKTGDGKQTFSRTNAYAGTTTINAGNLQFEVGGRCVNSTVILNATTATNGVSITDNTKIWTCAGLTAAAAGTLEFDFGSVAPSASVSPLSITGTADFSAATPKVRVVTTGLSPGTYPLMTWGATLGTAPTTADLTVDTLAPLTEASLSVVGNTLNLEITSAAGTIVKANNTTNLNLGTSWVGGVAPTASKVARWDSTVSSPNTTVLGANVTWAGIEIVDPTGLVTINPGNTLTLGGVATNIDMSTATADLALNCGLALSYDNLWDVAPGRTLTVSGAVSGTNALATQNAGRVIISSSGNSYSGDTAVGATSTLKLGAANVIPNGTGNGNLTVDGILDLNGNSEAINALSGVGTVDTLAGGNPTLTVGVDSYYTNSPGDFSGIIQNTAGTLSLSKTGTNLVALSGINTFSGAVKINEGYLAVGSVSAETDVLPNVSSITISNGATLGAWTNTILTKPIILASGGTAQIAAVINGTGGTGARDFALQGGITGNGNVIFKGVNNANGYGHIVVQNCTYTGSTLITCSGELSPGFFSAVQTNNNEIMVRLAGNNGLPTTTVVTMDGGNGVGSGVGRYCDLSLAGWSQTLAGLTNVPGRNLRVQRVVNNDAAAAATLTINNSADYTFSGGLGGTGGALGAASTPGNNFNLVKSGSGTFTISRDAGNTYANGTTINGGTLLVNNLTGSGTGPSDVNVNSGGTLGGTGSIAGGVLVNAGGGLAPGVSIGTLTINGILVLDALSTNTFEVNGSAPTNDAVVVGSTVSYGGVLKIVPTGTFTNGQTFTLFSGPGATDPSNFASVQSPSGVFAFTNGVLTVVTAPITGPSGPATLTNSVSGSTLSLSWPAGQNWRLQQQTNALSKGLSTNWVYVTDSSVSSTNITVDKTKPTTFYRLVYP